MRVDAVLVVEERQVLVDGHFQERRRHTGAEVEQLGEVEIVRRRQRGKAKAQQCAGSQSIGRVEREIAVDGLGVLVLAEVLHRAQVSGEDPVGPQALEALVVAFFAWLLHARRGDHDAHAGRAHPGNGDAEPHQLHEVELHLGEAEAQGDVHLLQCSQKRNELRPVVRRGRMERRDHGVGPVAGADVPLRRGQFV